jgi:hypothetical protein
VSVVALVMKIDDERWKVTLDTPEQSPRYNQILRHDESASVGIQGKHGALVWVLGQGSRRVVCYCSGETGWKHGWEMSDVVDPVMDVDVERWKANLDTPIPSPS